MLRYLILTQSRATGAALGLLRDMLHFRDGIECESSPAPIVVDSQRLKEESGMRTFEWVADRIERDATGESPSIRLNSVAVLVDSVYPEGMSAICESGTWENLLAMLVLSFPELKWTFGTVEGTRKSAFPHEDHDLAATLVQPRRDPLFDPTGLRSWVRRITEQDLHQLQMDYGRPTYAIPQRSHLAAAIEDEAPYAYYNAYAAYRFGFRADVVTSFALMRHLFVDQHHYQLLLEDMRLEFSDKPWSIGLSSLAEHYPCGEKQGRAAHFPALSIENDDSQWRILITTGAAKEYDQRLIKLNKAFLAMRQQGGGEIVGKPLGGILDIWDKSGLSSGLKEDYGRVGNARGFYWPPKFDELGGTARAGHGAPGKLVNVAERLLRRAEGLHASATSLEQYLTAAVLAADASELLNGRSPTATLNAVALRHECEVKAECEFLGVSFQIKGIESRIKEIKLECERVCEWFQEIVQEEEGAVPLAAGEAPPSRPDRSRPVPEASQRAGRSEAHQLAMLNAEAIILNRLALAFRSVGQLDEELKCLGELRSVNRALTLQKDPAIAALCQSVGLVRKAFETASNTRPVQWLSLLASGYAEWLLVSFSRFFPAIATWVIVLSLLTWALGVRETSWASLFDSFSLVLAWFCGAGATPPNPLTPIGFVISWIAVFAGVFHLGILISYLYTLVSRR